MTDKDKAKLWRAQVKKRRKELFGGLRERPWWDRRPGLPIHVGSLDKKKYKHSREHTEAIDAKITKALVLDLYHKRKWSLERISRETGVSKGAVQTRVRRYGLMRSKYDSPAPDFKEAIDENWAQYIEDQNREEVKGC